MTASTAFPLLGFHCSHEQHSPALLLRLAQRAEDAGFTAAMCSDHFHPWTPAQGQAGFTWSWLGAAMQATQMSFGTVCAPGQRYHPAIVAQAAATLCDMFPGRFWIAVGTGEALNECITGAPWPSKADRRRRLEECVAIMRALWNGETVTHQGLVTVRDAALYSRPSAPPLVVGAAITEETAAWAATWADALITVPRARDEMRAVRDAFRAGAGAQKPIWLQVPMAIGETDEDSRHAARTEWPQAALAPVQLADLDSPVAFEAATQQVSEDAILRAVRASADIERQLAWLHEDAQLGYERIYLHNVHRNHQPFFEAFAQRLGKWSRR